MVIASEVWDIIPSISLEQLGLDVVKLGVPSVYSVWVGVDSDILWTGELSKPDPWSSSFAIWPALPIISTLSDMHNFKADLIRNT